MNVPKSAWPCGSFQANVWPSPHTFGIILDLISILFVIPILNYPGQRWVTQASNHIFAPNKRPLLESCDDQSRKFQWSQLVSERKVST